MVDTPALGAGIRKDVEVRVLFPAPIKSLIERWDFLVSRHDLDKM